MTSKTVATNLLVLVVILALVPSAPAEERSGEVIAVEKGDMLSVSDKGKTVKIVLHGVRCPGLSEPHGREALAFTSRLTLHKRIRYGIHERRGSGEFVATVVLPDGSILNHRLVRSGLASWDREAAPNDIQLQSLEDSARQLNLGIWAPTAGPAPGAPPPRSGPSRSTSRAVAGTRTTHPVTKTPGRAVFSTLLALVLVVLVAGLFFLRNRRRAGPAEPAAPGEASPPKPPALRGPALHEQEEQARAIESSRQAIQELLESLSEFVSGLVESNASYDMRMKDHKASIHKAMTMAGLEEIKRLLVREIEAMEATSEDYRRQLEHANATIREQQEIMERFKIDAKMDFLTRIPNRRAFEDRLKEEFERTRRYQGVFSLIMFDIDHFKQVNDTYGHMAGDNLLRLIAQVLEEQTRFNDFVGRYGGEEFVVLLPESTLEDGRLVANKIRQAVEAASLKVGNAKLKVTVSAGVGQVDTRGDTPEALIERVDAALYEAKKRGRNRVEVAAGQGSAGGDA